MFSSMMYLHIMYLKMCFFKYTLVHEYISTILCVDYVYEEFFFSFLNLYLFYFFFKTFFHYSWFIDKKINQLKKKWEMLFEPDWGL